MSIPRDLKVKIPGHGTDKINAAYALGGAGSRVQTVKALLDIPINHVVNVNFGGFQRAVNRLGCVYVDVDRRYFNDNTRRGGAGGYATIDIKPGYQKLCGADSLDYVRFRHLDTDFVRAARQQDFLRQAKDQFGLGKLFGYRKELLKIFGRYTQTDIRAHDAAILRLLKLASSRRRTRSARSTSAATQPATGELRRDTPRALQRRPSTSSSTPASAGPRGRTARQDATKQAQAGRRPSELARRRSSLRTEARRGLRPADRGEAAAASRSTSRRRIACARGGYASDTARASTTSTTAASNKLPRLPDRRSTQGDDRPVLRRPGHDLEGAADPRQPHRRGAHARAHVRALLRRQRRCG